MNKGIYSRGYLPHWDFAKSLQAITFRLADSVPTGVIDEWRRELGFMQDDSRLQKELHRRIAKYEDKGHGDAVLRIPAIAEIIQSRLISGHPGSYKLIEWCVMPNHVHVMLKLAPSESLSSVMRVVKGSTSLAINRALGREGRLWGPDYYDRFIRDTDHYHECVAYIRNNPVKAGLCRAPEDWPYSSKGIGWSADFSPPESMSEPESPQEPQAD